MFRAARRADPRPAAAVGLGRLSADGAKGVAAMPVGQAQRRRKGRGVAGIEQRQQLEMSAGVDRRRSIGQARKARRLAVEAEPDNMAYLDSLGWVLYKRGKFDEARRHLDDATKSAIDALEWRKRRDQTLSGTMPRTRAASTSS